MKRNSSGRFVSAHTEIGGSGGVALRRSPRLRGKTAMATPKGRKITPRKSPNEDMSSPRPRTRVVEHQLRRGKSAKTSSSNRPSKDRGMTSDSSDENDIEKIMRADREHEAIHFKKMYKLKDDCPEERMMCIHPRGDFRWSKRSFGITWVAFRGTGCTYVVFRKTLVKDRLTSYLAYNPAAISFDLLGTSIISEIEVLADLPSGSSQKFPETCEGQHVHAPFAIVSVVPGTVEDGREEDALNYLRDEIENWKGRYFSPIKAEVAALRALHKLYKQQPFNPEDMPFKPEDLWVHEAFYGREGCISSATLKHILNVACWLEGVDIKFEDASTKDDYMDMLK